MALSKRVVKKQRRGPRAGSKGLPDGVEAELASHCNRCVDDDCGCKKYAWQIGTWRNEFPIFTPLLLSFAGEDDIELVKQGLELDDTWISYEIDHCGRFVAGCNLCREFAIKGVGDYSFTEFKICSCAQLKHYCLKKHHEAW